MKRHRMGMLMIGLLALSLGCQNGAVTITRIVDGKPVLLARSKPTAEHAVFQTVQTLKESITPPGQSGNTSAPPAPSVTIQAERPPVLKVDNLEPAAPPPANTPVIELPNVQDDKHSSKESRSSSGSSSGGGGGSRSFSSEPTRVTPQPNHFLTISQVYLTDEGPTASIVGPDAPRELRPDFNTGTEWKISIEGDFRTAPATMLDNASFVFDDPKVLAMSLVGKEPPVRVLTDSTILWTPVEASPTKIVAKINTKGIPDLYLKGLHTLSVEAGQLIYQVKVKVGEPLSPASLSPVIDNVEVLKDPVTHRPVNLRVTGKNLMMHYRYAFAQCDSLFAFGHQTTLIQGDNGLVWEKIIHIPDIPAFEQKNEHTLSYVTPFGASFKSFQGGQQ